MRQIWKYLIPCELNELGIGYSEKTEVEMPGGAEIISVQTQGNRPMVWAIVDPSKPIEKRRVFMIATGKPMPEEARKFIGTLQLNDGNLIFHFFE